MLPYIKDLFNLIDRGHFTLFLVKVNYAGLWKQNMTIWNQLGSNINSLLPEHH